MALVNAFGAIALDETNSELSFAKAEILNSHGNVTNIKRKSLQKFGQNLSVGTTESTLCWDGILPKRSTTNSITTVSSSSAADTTQVVRVEGMYLDGSDNFLFSFQNVTLNGQNKVTLTQPLARVTRIANVTSTTATAGDIYVYEDGAITGGVPNDLTTVGNIMPFEHQSTMFAGTSISSTNYFILTNIHASLGYSGSRGAFADVTFKIRDKDSVFRTVEINTVSDGSANQFHVGPHIIVPPNSDIVMTAIASTTGVSVSGGFEGYFADIV